MYLGNLWPLNGLDVIADPKYDVISIIVHGLDER